MSYVLPKLAWKLYYEQINNCFVYLLYIINHRNKLAENDADMRAYNSCSMTLA